ncbi:hypothetical protein [Pseudomonas sp. SED1]|uniref:hypothetical protein n=1 Tax=Pseudomonas sp. SED1 TaxID=3056845 RepID=UPI00296F9782|nr:hypothetical protein [Pseudomonas sp. SED1]MDY0834172.1 hypothetical protein [Pseudomonas sp. SED1]
MNPNAVSVAVVDGKTISKTVELGSVGRGGTVSIRAIKGGAYLLAEGADKLAPQNVTVKRVGTDLHLSLECGELEQPQLIIEDFYGTNGQLVGLAEDGSFHEYVASDAITEQDMAEGGVSALALGATPLTGFGAGGEGGSFWTPTLMGLGALGVAGAIAAIGGGGGGGGGQVAPETQPRPEPALEPQTQPETIPTQGEVPEKQAPIEPEEGIRQPPNGKSNEVADQPGENQAVVDQGQASVQMSAEGTPMFDYSAVVQLSHSQSNADQPWAIALSLGDVLSYGVGELFVTDTTADATSQSTCRAQEVDPQALISDEEIENWSIQSDVSSSGAVYELAQPSTSVDDALFYGLE